MIPVIFSTPIYSTPENPRTHCCLQLIESIRRSFSQDAYLHVIVNDGSTDHTAFLLEQLAREDPNLIAVNHEKRDGTFAFNLGIDISLYPERHVDLIGATAAGKIRALAPALVNFTGVDDLIGPDVPQAISSIRCYPAGTAVFWGDYRAFLADFPFSAQARAPHAATPSDLFRLLFYCENFPSHLLYFRTEFLRGLHESRGFELGVLDPELLSPITYELMMFTVVYAINNGYSFGYLPGNLGYKRYGISGTMTQQNKKSGRYLRERQVVFERYSRSAPQLCGSSFTERPELDRRYFRPLTEFDQVVYDTDLEQLLEAGTAVFRRLTATQFKEERQ